MNTSKVENNPSLVRDLDNKAVLNTNNAALEAFLRKREQFEKIDKMESRLNGLEDKLDLILKLLNK